MMKKAGNGALLLLFLWNTGVPAQSQDPAPLQEACRELTGKTRLPVKLSTRGKVRRARWEQVDKVLSGLERDLRGSRCRLEFQQIFRTDRPDLLFPITNTLLRVVPESTLAGVTVFSRDGATLGEFAGRSTYSRKGDLYAVDSYSLYYFQFRDAEGQMQSSGTELLLDTFLMKWDEILDRQAIGSNP